MFLLYEDGLYIYTRGYEFFIPKQKMYSFFKFGFWINNLSHAIKSHLIMDSGTWNRYIINISFPALKRAKNIQIQTVMN